MCEVSRTASLAGARTFPTSSIHASRPFASKKSTRRFAACSSSPEGEGIDTMSNSSFRAGVSQASG